MILSRDQQNFDIFKKLNFFFNLQEFFRDTQFYNFGPRYKFGPGAEILYVASGGSDDWTHKIGIPISYAIELRPTQQSRVGFLLPEREIQPTCIENVDALEKLYQHVKNRACTSDYICENGGQPGGSNNGPD